MTATSPNLLAAIAEGAVRGALCGKDGCDEATAKDFAVAVLDQALGAGAGEAWRQSSFKRSRCSNCGDGFDDENWHLMVCPAVGKEPLSPGCKVRLAHLSDS